MPLQVLLLQFVPHYYGNFYKFLQQYLHRIKINRHDSIQGKLATNI